MSKSVGILLALGFTILILGVYAEIIQDEKITGVKSCATVKVEAVPGIDSAGNYPAGVYTFYYADSILVDVEPGDKCKK